jgi:CMP-N-acetylneuraminic acid synthetase
MCVVAIIPVREGSQRVKNKNFRPFASHPSLLGLKISQLKHEGCFDRIYVSSDSERAREIALEYGVEFLPRSSEFCSSEIRWSEVIQYVVGTIPGDPVVAWVHTTSPLQREYAKPVNCFLSQRERYDSLVTVHRTQEFILRENGRPVNYCYGHWHDYSQDLEALFTVTGALFIAKKSDIVRWSYLIGVRPYLYEVSRFEALDVDEEEDFALAELVDQHASVLIPDK